MKRALISKNKWKFLDGSIPVPDQFDPNFDAWERSNNLIHSWLVNSVSPGITQSLIHIDLASIVWKNLRERFSQGDLTRIAKLQQELYSFKQGNLLVTEFFIELTAYWEEFENYRPVHDYNCESKNLRNQDYIMRFLMGLNDCYSVIKTQVLLTDPLPSLNRVFSMILQYERQNGFDDVEENQVVINVADGKRYIKGKHYGSKVCIYCGRTGHTGNLLSQAWLSTWIQDEELQFKCE